MKRCIALLVIAVCSVVASGATQTMAAADFRPRIGVQSQDFGGKTAAVITVNEEPAALLKSSAGGHGPDIRAVLVAARLQSLIANGLAPGDVKAVKSEGNVWKVAARGQDILLAPPAEAVAHGTNSKSLAQSWAASLRRLLSEPQIKLSSSGIVVPYNETRTVRVGGAALATDIVAQDSDSHVSLAHFDSGTRQLSVRGMLPGRDQVLVQSQGATVSLPVVVMKYAAQIAPAVTVSVTGDPAPADIVLRAAYAGLARAVNAEDGAAVHLSSFPRIVRPLGSGDSLTFSVPMRVAGSALLPVEASPTITVLNNPISIRPASTLFYSNNPEQLKQGQALFAGNLLPLTSVRLDYHHQNIGTMPLIFHVDLINQSGAPATVQVISGVSLPAADTVQVGRRAGASFLRALDSDAGLVLDIPPHSRLPLVTQRFGPGLTVSGIVQLQQVGGDSNAVSVEVAADGNQSPLASSLARLILAGLPDERAASPLPNQPTALGGSVPLPTPSPYTFSTPQIALDSTYSVGGKWTHVRIGQTKPLKNLTGKLTLWGNYGADYTITLTIKNPTAVPKPVGVFFAPEAGSAAGVFRIDGGPVLEFDPVVPPLELPLARYVIAPGETRQVRVETIPLNGSSYPASLLVHAL